MQVKNFLMFAGICLLILPANAQNGNPIVPHQLPGMVGFWDFESNSNLWQSPIGKPLIPEGSSGSLTQVAGPGANDMAVRKTQGRHLKCIHGIPPNGGSTSHSNQYTLVLDFKVPDITAYRSFFQTDVSNSNDADSWMNASGKIGIGSMGYSYSTINANEWYRLAVSVDCSRSIVYYIDGQVWNPGNADVLNGRFSLDPEGVLLFADENGEDGQLDIAKIVLFNRALSSGEVFSLGGYGHAVMDPANKTDINPYLQTPGPTSIYISWHSLNTGSSTVKYGTTPNNLPFTKTGSYKAIGGNNNYIWHTVHLTGLIPNTEYFYRCYSGKDSTGKTFAFRTPALRNTPGKHLRFVVAGDNRTDVAATTSNMLKIKNKLVQLYGPDLHNHIDLICNTGDVVSNGNNVGEYINEFFTPFAPLTHAIPTMIAIGNHENNSSNYFEYVKYEDLTTSYPPSHTYNEKFYQLILGSAQFLFMNANSQYKNVAAQWAWMEDRLKESDANKDIDFVFSFTHHPARSEVWPDGNEPRVENDLLGRSRKFHKSAIHFSGHSHNYERGTLEINSSNASKHNDMREVLSGGAGSALDRWGMYPNQTDYPEVNLSRDVYCWMLVDIDIDNKSYTAETFSFGHKDRPANNERIDFVYRKINQAGPAKAHAAGVINSNVLVASSMNGIDSAMTCHFQVTKTPGDYSSPLLQVKQDKYNIYDDSRAPQWLPIDKNSNLDIKRYKIKTSDNLSPGTQYGYRVRYRDNNLEWGPWSDEKTFIYSNTPSAQVDFSADLLTGPVGMKVNFSDLSGVKASAWQWDFNNDGVIDSYKKDPLHQYNAPGYYTVKLTVNDGTSNYAASKTNYIHVTNITSVEDTDAVRINVQVYPNPFHSSTTFSFSLKQAEHVIAEIIDLSGNTVNVLYTGQLQAGEQSLSWDGKGTNGNVLSPGEYFLKLKGSNVYVVKSVILQ